MAFTPERASVALKVMATGTLLVQVEGMPVAVVDGAVWSIENVIVPVVAVSPAPFVTVPLAVKCFPSLLKSRSGGQLATPETASEHTKCTVTGLVNQAGVVAGS